MTYTHLPHGKLLRKFASGGKPIRVETFPGPENAPSVVVLHGATGVEYANRFIATLAQAFAHHGFEVHLIHYFDRTGGERADDEAIAKSSAEWKETVDDAVNFIHAEHAAAPVGIFGYSLGGYLAAATSVKNCWVRAAVVLAGGIDEPSTKNIHHVAPTLILHGSEDTRVVPYEAQKLEIALRGAGISPETHLYAGEGHVMSPEAYQDVVRRSVIFFRKHLSPPAP